MNLENGLKKEWLITNGIGGYASSTIIGANTRRYHGLLFDALKPPAKRVLVLSKLDESIQIDNKKIDLYTNMCENYVSKGFKDQVGFEKRTVPSFNYKVDGIRISKKICMARGKNIVGVYYKIRTADEEVKFTIAPVVNFRDFHDMSTNREFKLSQKINASDGKDVFLKS